MILTPFKTTYGVRWDCDLEDDIFAWHNGHYPEKFWAIETSFQIEPNMHMRFVGLSHNYEDGLSDHTLMWDPTNLPWVLV